jgi:phage protein D
MNEALVPQCNLLLNGQQASQKALNDLLDCVVENSLHLPDVCTLRIHDADFTWLDSALFLEGSSVEIQMGYGSASLKTVFIGEITGLELDLTAQSVPTIVVRCYDRSHRLHRGRSTRAFVNVLDSDVVASVAAEAGFSTDIDKTTVVHDWILQRNQTDWEFLRDRAKRNGFRLYHQGSRTLMFKKVGNVPSSVVSIEWGVDLRSFRPRTSATHQVSSVTVNGWDPDHKQKITGSSRTANTFPEVGEHEDGGVLAQAAFGDANMVIVGKPIHSTEEAQAMAQSVRDSIAGEYLQADGLCDGKPDLKPGAEVEIKNIGSRFGGKYYVTSTTHVFSHAEGYATQFAVSGKNPNTVVSLLDHREVADDAIGGNIVVGVVTDNKDPENMGRVKVKYPWLDDILTSYWARTVSQMAGSSRGMFNLPEIGDEVLVAFEMGEITSPYVLGMLWNGVDALPTVDGNPTLKDGKVNRRGFVTRIGHQMTYDDTDDKGNITFLTKGAHRITFDDANQQVNMTTTGKHTFTMDDKNLNIQAKTNGGHLLILDDQNHQIHVKTTNGLEMLMNDNGPCITVQDPAGNKVVIDGGSAKITLSSMGDIAMQAVGNIDIQAQMNVSIKGLQVSAQAETQLSLEGQAMASLNSSGMLQIQGDMVMIN